MKARIALASCGSLPPEERDDDFLVTALQAKGATVSTVPWDEPGFDGSGFDLVLLRTTWDYVPRRAEFCRWVELVERTTRLENPAGLVTWNTDKSYLAELSERGLPTIPSVVVDGHESLRPPAEWRAERAFLKPVIGAGANATLRFDLDAQGMARAGEHLEMNSEAGPFLLQPYQEAVETRGEVSLIWLAGQWTHAVRKVPVSGDWRVQDDHGASDALHEPSPAERDVARAALELVGNPLYLRVDLLEGASGEPLVVELELVEPSLFFRHAPKAADVLAQGVLDRLAGAGS